MMIKPRNKSVPRPKSLPIDEIRKKFRTKREYLLIKVDKFDKSRTKALTGHLLAHSPHEDEIMRLSIKHRGLTLVEFSENKLPANTVVLF